MEYIQLKKLFHINENECHQLYERRFFGESTNRLGIKLKSGYECFYVLNDEILSLIDKVYTINTWIEKVMASDILPNSAKSYLFVKSLVEEIKSSNQMEGIYSTRKELKNMFIEPSSQKYKRFYGMVNKYRKLQDEPFSSIHSVIDIRKLYDEILLEINKPLMLIGLQMTNEGKLLKIEAATTISEVERRTRDLVSELQKRHIHQDVIKCCKEEYLQENYFHAIFEAAKSLSEKVREKTGMQDDGSNLFNNAFAVNNPRLAINSLQTPSERNAQNGLKEMLNGVTHMVRNVTAHELKIKWIVNEQDAIDILTTISFLHKQLDECFVVPQHIA